MRLVICDDHQLLLDGLTAALSRAGHEVVASIDDPAQAVVEVARHRPDACLLDLNFPVLMPAEDTMAVLPRIVAASRRTRVVILSATAQPSVVAEAISRGADGFVGKHRPLAHIVATLERVVGGTGERSRRHRGVVDDPAWVLRFLTDREWQVLRCILDGQSTEQMAVELGVRRSTARTHVQNLLTKLGLHSRLQVAAMITAHGEAVMRTGVWEAS